MKKENYGFKHKKNPVLVGFGKQKPQESDFLYREDCDETTFFSFIGEDFDASSSNPDTLFVLRRISASYKHILTSEFRNFWSTLKHNLLLRRSLSSFLQYAQRRRFNDYYRQGHGHDQPQNSAADTIISPITTASEYDSLMKQIYRDVLSIFYRIASCENENAVKAVEFGCYKMILDEWLIDIPKILDIIAIYGAKNERIVRELTLICFSTQKEFQADFDELQDNILKEYLDRAYKEILMLKKKDRLGSASTDISDADIDRKVELLVTLSDISATLLDILKFFPKTENEKLLLDDRINLIMENLFYELIFAREEAWVMGKYRGDIILISDVVLSRFTEFFSEFFNLMITVFADKNLIKQNIGKKMTTMWNKYLKDLGKIQSFGKKQGENRYWYLIEYVSDHVDFQRLFEVAPQDISEEYQLFNIQVVSVIEERRRNVIQYQNKKLDYANKGDEEKSLEKQLSEETPNLVFIDATLAQQQLKEKQDKQRREEEIVSARLLEAERRRQEQDREDEAGKAYEPKEEILTVYQKGRMKVNMKMSQEDERKYRQKTLFLAMEYEDEPDDSYHYHSIAMSGKQNDQTENNQSDDSDIADEEDYDEQGNRIHKNPREEGIDDGRRRQFVPKQRNGFQKSEFTKPNTYEGRLKYRDCHPKQNQQGEGNTQTSTGQTQSRQTDNRKQYSQEDGYQKKNTHPQGQQQPQQQSQQQPQYVLGNQLKKPNRKDEDSQENTKQWQPRDYNGGYKGKPSNSNTNNYQPGTSGNTQKNGQKRNNKD